MEQDFWTQVDAWPLWLKALAVGVTIATIIAIVRHDWHNDE